MDVRTIYEDEEFLVYTDKSGKFWLWNKLLEQNHAMRSSTELQAYREAINSLIFQVDLVSQYRKDAERKLNLLQECFEKVFPGENDE